MPLCTLRRESIIGNRVKIRPFTFIPSGVKIEDDVFIGPHVTFTNDKYPKISADWKLLRTTIGKEQVSEQDQWCFL